MTNFVLRECGDKRKEVSIARKFIKKFVTPKKNVDLKEIIQDRMNRIRDKMNDVKIDLELGIEELQEYAKERREERAIKAQQRSEERAARAQQRLDERTLKRNIKDYIR